MAVKNIYVPDGDPEVALLWEQVATVASRERRSVSWVIHEALRMYLRQISIEEAKRGRGAGRA